jgi:hypothetical protein
VGYTFSLKTSSMLLIKQVLRVMKWCALATFCGAFGEGSAVGRLGLDVALVFQLFERGQGCGDGFTEISGHDFSPLAAMNE